MTILIINNYEKEEDQSKVDQIADALKKIGKTKCVICRFSEIHEKEIPEDLEALILSGSRAHLQNSSHLSRYEAEIELIRHANVPILGICFGHQLIGKAFGSSIEALPKFLSEFMKIKVLDPDEIFHFLETGKKITVCQSHQDYVADLPSNFVCLAESETCKIEAMKHRNKPIYGVQAHIERATDQNPDGRRVMENFVSLVVNKRKRKAEDMQSKVSHRTFYKGELYTRRLNSRSFCLLSPSCLFCTA